MSRESRFENRGKRFFRVPEEGVPLTIVDREFDAAKTRFPLVYGDEQWAKPGTKPDRIALHYAVRMVEDRNPNLVEPTMFKGAWEIEREAVSMIADLFHHPLYSKEAYDPKADPPLGWFTDGGTSSILQATWSLRNKYFHDLEHTLFPEFDPSKTKGIVRKEGLLGLIRRGLIDPNKSPVILAPVDMHFAGDKVIDVLGLGSEAIVRYSMNEEYKTDYAALDSLVQNLHRDGRKIMFAFATAGAVDTGRVEDVHKFSITLRNAGSSAPIIVDAAQQYMMLALLNNEYPIWDFREEGVEAIVADPHKTDATPYPGSVVIFRNKDIALHTRNDVGYLHIKDDIDYDLKETWNLMPQLPTSRSPIGAVATWVHLLHRGKRDLTAAYSTMRNLTLRLADDINHNPYLQTICAPETGIVAFHFKDMNDAKAKKLYEKFVTCNDSPRFYISFADCIRLRTQEEYGRYMLHKDAKSETGFGGLYIQVMHHATEELIEQLVDRIERFTKEVEKKA